MKPAITIITPTYNRASMLLEVLESISKQNFCDFEHIIVDDGSIDETKSVVEKFQNKYGDNELIYFYQENAGEATAVNVGWQMARGKYVVIINSDDPQPQYLLTELFDFMENNQDITVGYPDWTSIDENGTAINSVTVGEYDPKEIILLGKCLPGPGTIIRREDIPIKELRDPRFPMVSDMGCWLKICVLGKKFARIPKTLACWREHPEGLSHIIRGERFADDKYELYKFFWREYKGTEWAGLKYNSLSRMAKNSATYILKGAPWYRRYRAIPYLGRYKVFKWCHIFKKGRSK